MVICGSPKHAFRPWNPQSAMQRGLRQDMFDAVGAGDLERLEAALAAGARVNAAVGSDVRGCPQRGFQALHIAAWRGHTDAVRLLLDRGASVRDASLPVACCKALAGYQALHAAAARGRDAVVGLLLRRGADVNATAGEACEQCLHARVPNMDGFGFVKHALAQGGWHAQLATLELGSMVPGSGLLPTFAGQHLPENPKSTS